MKLLDTVWNQLTYLFLIVPLCETVCNRRVLFCFLVLFSVGQPFQGAYLEIHKNPKYKKLKDAIEEKIIIAEVVNKINRANGKVKPLTLETCRSVYQLGQSSLIFWLLKLVFHIPSRITMKGVISPYL